MIPVLYWSIKSWDTQGHQQTAAARAKILHCCARHLWSERLTAANNQWDLKTEHVLDSYNKYKKETQVIVGISAIPIGQ